MGGSGDLLEFNGRIIPELAYVHNNFQTQPKHILKFLAQETPYYG